MRAMVNGVSTVYKPGVHFEGSSFENCVNRGSYLTPRIFPSQALNPLRDLIFSLLEEIVKQNKTQRKRQRCLSYCMRKVSTKLDKLKLVCLFFLNFSVQ